MTDEEFLFHQDCAEKKRTATGAHHKSTHGGRVVMPSDFLSKKEKEAMNSEVITIRLNEPHNWSEFLQMPEEFQVEYLNNLYDKYNPSLSMMSKMFDISVPSISVALKKKNLPTSGCNRKRTHEEIAAWEKFLGTKTAVLDEEPCGHPDPVGEPGDPGVPWFPVNAVDPACTTGENGAVDYVKLLSEVQNPKSGTVTFCGDVKKVLYSVMRLFAGNPNVEMTVSWEVHDA